MCGICGYIKLNDVDQLNQRELLKMTNTMQHRGPDDMGYHSDDNLSLGMRRLSIIDTEKGNQPIYSDNKKIVIVMNGELYNYQELKQKLIDKGITF